VRQVGLDVDQVVIDLDHVVETRADRSKRRFQVFERLGHLGAEVARHAAVGFQSKLPGDVNDPAGARGLHHVAVAAGLGDGRRIHEPRVGRHGLPPFWIRPPPHAAAAAHYTRNRMTVRNRLLTRQVR
jgi:hypothetical protein